MSSPTTVTLDVVLLPPPPLRRQAVSSSAGLARRMAANGYPSHFRLGAAYPHDPAGGVCEPHVSLFMLAVSPSEIPLVVDAVRAVAQALPPLYGEGEEYRHNPQGAPELYFRRSPAWVELQREVIRRVEPLRRGRLRELSPAGERLHDVLAGRVPADPAAVSQLARYGYDEVAAPDGDRFNPHVTLAWPDDPNSRIALTGLPPARTYSGPLSDIAVYGMSPYGTCTTDHGSFSLRDQRRPAPAVKPVKAAAGPTLGADRHRPAVTARPSASGFLAPS
ncbi:MULTISPECIES: hypothetical protein [Protofrankia]|uniref:2'-5' RNA ligase n=1 Tax=Candidatus Protofrankia datiscae TaxID=2716812 RepID=F8B6H6_9ACTN|nr:MULTISPECIES: hypothetical protein [Protofrankia]AEH09274.1 hypothetical protein FsymDg_1827 [Candidatus Protofrankia datiscae]